MFRYKNQMLPLILSNLFRTNKQIHNYNTRSAGNYRPHACRTNLKQFTILYQGPKIWNALPLHIKHSPDLSSFKKHMKVFVKVNQFRVAHSKKVRSCKRINWVFFFLKCAV